MEKAIRIEDLQRFEAGFDAERANVVAMNAVTKNGICDAAENVKAAPDNLHAYSVMVEAGDACNQKKSGRCWMFASLNVMRLKVMDKLNLKNAKCWKYL